MPSRFTTRELSARTLPDFEMLAAKQGGCWCMYYQRPKPIGRKVTSAEWKRINRKDKRALVRQGRSHAIMVYEGKTPVGWCQYGSPEQLPRIDAGRNYRRVGLLVMARNCGESHVSSWTERTEGEGSPSSR